MPNQLDKFMDEESQAVLPSPEVALRSFLDSTPTEQISSGSIVRAAAAARGLELPDYMDLQVAVQDAMSEPESERADGVDVLRDTPIRLLGYANEVGESFRPVLPRLVAPTYIVAAGYVLADTVDKTLKSTRAGHDAHRTAAVAVDTLLWQTFASVLVPGLLINRMVRVATMVSARAGAPPAVRRWGPTAVGLAIIPALVQPVDHWVHTIMNKFRPAIGLAQEW